MAQTPCSAQARVAPDIDGSGFGSREIDRRALDAASTVPRFDSSPARCSLDRRGG